MENRWRLLQFNSHDHTTHWMVTDTSRPLHQTYLLYVFDNIQAAQAYADQLNQTKEP